MDTKLYEHCKCITNSSNHWMALSNLLNAMLTEECDRLIMSSDLPTIKEAQGRIKMIRQLLSLPNEVRRREEAHATDNH